LIESIVISLSTIVDQYRFNSLDRKCVFPCQQVVFGRRCCVRPYLAQCATLHALHIGMFKLQTQCTLHCLLEGPSLCLRGRHESAKLGQPKSQLLVIEVQHPFYNLR
jgi:hypothetical protein